MGRCFVSLTQLGPQPLNCLRQSLSAAEIWRQAAAGQAKILRTSKQTDIATVHIVPLHAAHLQSEWGGHWASRGITHCPALHVLALDKLQFKHAAAVW